MLTPNLENGKHDFAILGTTKSPEFCDLMERDGL